MPSNENREFTDFHFFTDLIDKIFTNNFSDEDPCSKNWFLKGHRYQPYHPSVYKKKFMGTRLTYEFNCYKILNQDEHFLRNNLNPFSAVVLTSLMAIKHKGISDEELENIKHDLYDEMKKPVIQGTQILTGRSATMGTREKASYQDIN